ncbi:SDR family oxidoreductase [Nocardia alni]|uniref:SDR family oxidoreductase n=1 Tax=Nocardia alni TaxID=2815723 RepID=UPI001C228F3B|nr:NAD(P)H-binding protein [Nocardia alni]
MSYLVVGGTGRTGRRAVDLLRESGRAAVVGARRPRGDEAVAVDLSRELNPELLQGIDGVLVSVEPPADDRGAEAVMHHGIENLAHAAAAQDIPLVLISQIYITRAAEHPDIAGIINARAAGEQALRDSRARYAIVRPAWLTNSPSTGGRLEQGDRGDGQVSRETVARAAVEALLNPAAHGKTFELYDDPHPVDWPVAFAELASD